MNFSFDRLHLVNTYGAFGTVTKIRHEVVLEGNDEDELTRTPRWHEYEFKSKPDDPHRRPPQVTPYHLRLDWMMWFVSISSRYGESWLPALVERLLKADRKTLTLFRLLRLTRAPSSANAVRTPPGSQGESLVELPVKWPKFRHRQGIPEQECL